MTPDEQLYLHIYKQLYEVCERNGWGDPFSYARSKEILMAILLEHRVSSTLSGADGFDDDGEYEYKSTTDKTIKGTYNGISVQDTWDEQERYLVEDKIGKYAKHYFARFEDGKCVELWELDAQDVLSLLLPKLKKQYESDKKSKDPRLGATINKTEIYKYGRQVLGQQEADVLSW